MPSLSPDIGYDLSAGVAPSLAVSLEDVQENFRRYGLLSLAVYFTFDTIMESAPLTLDASVWYFGRSFFLIAVMSLIASYAFWISLAAQPAFGVALLEED